MAKDSSGLCIKLKIPQRFKPTENQEEGEEEDDDSSQKLQAFSRVCHVCNKGFSSGKALGGHMRMHVQARKKISDDREGSGELYFNGGRSEEHVCFSCRKVFPSKKSLFGHMRSHPERPWRGIHPPAVANRYSSSSTLSDENSPEFKFDDGFDTAGTKRAPAMDLSRSLLGWSVTAKRGRKSISSAASSDSSASLEDRMFSAVNDLMLFAANRATESNTDQDFVDPDCSPRKKMRNASPEKRKNISDEEISELEMGRIKMEKKKGKKMRLVDLETEETFAGETKKTTLKQPENNNTYRCSTCSKTFSTHQALGGHRSSHNKGKNVSAIEAQTEAQLKEEATERGRKILEFDLNELPSLTHEEEEEEGIKNGDFFHA